MRVLLVADLHYNLPQLDWVVSAAPSFDLVVMAGDHLDISSTVPLDAQCVVIERYVERIREHTTVAVSSGNHDLTGPDPAGEQAALWISRLRANGVLIDGDSVVVGDTLVTVCPFWDGEQGRLAVDVLLAAEAARRTTRWLWVYHWPPMDSPTSWTGKRHYGDADLNAWVGAHQPDLVLTGHVHQSPFSPDGGWVDLIDRTWIFNAGRQIGKVPTRVEIDLDGGSAAWISMLGIEEQRLDADRPVARSVV